MISQQILDSLSKFFPELTLSAFILILLIVELTVQQNNLGPQVNFFGMVAIDPFSYFFKVLLLLSGLLIILFSFLSDDVKKVDYKTQEY